MSQPKLLKVSKPLAVTLDLPNSVQRDEIIAVPVVVHNHVDRDIIVEVTLQNNEQKFQFAEVSNEANYTKSKNFMKQKLNKNNLLFPYSEIELNRRKRLSVEKHGRALVSFMITPTKLGYTEIKVKATYSNLEDTITKMLHVQVSLIYIGCN